MRPLFCSIRSHASLLTQVQGSPKHSLLCVLTLRMEPSHSVITQLRACFFSDLCGFPAMQVSEVLGRAKGFKTSTVNSKQSWLTMTKCSNSLVANKNELLGELSRILKLAELRVRCISVIYDEPFHGWIPGDNQTCHSEILASSNKTRIS